MMSISDWGFRAQLAMFNRLATARRAVVEHADFSKLASRSARVNILSEQTKN